MREEQLKALLQDMSTEEKIGQLLQVAGTLFGEDSLITGALDYFKITQEELDRTGSILSISGAERLKKVQDACMAKQPHHIPQLFMLDIINGFETIYPVPLAQGATFDPDMAEKLAEMAAREGSAAGIHVTFSPMADLVRDARWGRVMESTGEDSFLNGKMSAAMVRGYQGRNVADKGRMAACVKHFAGYGGAEGGRDYDTVELSERTLRDEYLPAYKEAIDADARLVMTSFNTLNHVPSTGNKWLMKKVLREEMGFDGVLISDYGAVAEMVNHGIAGDEKDAAELALGAGVDIEMMSLAYVRHVEELIAEGRLAMEQVDEACLRVLRLKNELGLFENPYKDADAEDEKALLLCDAHRKLAREAAAESFCLLKNEDGILPLKNQAGEKVAFIGPYCDNHEVYGSWSFPSDASKMVSIRQGVEKAGMEADISFCEGSQMFGADYRLKDGRRFSYDAGKKQPLLDEAIAAAKEADRVVLCLGEHSQQTGEAASRTDITIPEEQMDLLRRVAEVNPNIVTLVFAGRPLELLEVSRLSKAVMMVWFPGCECGNAVADVLFGAKEPGGRLPMSFPYTVAQEPCYYNRFRSGRPNNGTLDQSFVMGYIDQMDRVLYPFGYGMGYTSFSYGPVRLSGDRLGDGQTITATVTLTNTGDREGTETVQLYLTDLFGSVVRPVKELRGFRRVSLQPGESAEVSFDITPDMLSFYNIDMKYTWEPGTCKVNIAGDSATENSAVFELV